MIAPEDLYITNLTALEQDLYRIGNASSPSFGEQRAFKDLVVRDQGGIKMVVANGNGYSALNRITVRMKLEKHIWKIRKGSALPEGIKLVKDLTNPIHFMLAPAKDMPLKKYLGLLEELATNPLAAVKMTQQEIKDAR